MFVGVVVLRCSYLNILRTCVVLWGSVPKNARYVVSRIRALLQNNMELLKDKDVKKWIRAMYPLLLEHSSSRDKEFFKSIYPYLFSEPHQQS